MRFRYFLLVKLEVLYGVNHLSRTSEVCKVQNCKLRELRHTGNCLSWAAKREHGWVQCRLDRCLSNSVWLSLFPRANMEYLDLWASDHRPIRVCFSLERDNPMKGRFFFDKRMLSREGFEDIVRLSWEEGMVIVAVRWAAFDVVDARSWNGNEN